MNRYIKGKKINNNKIKNKKNRVIHKSKKANEIENALPKRQLKISIKTMPEGGRVEMPLTITKIGNEVTPDVIEKIKRAFKKYIDSTVLPIIEEFAVAIWVDIQLLYQNKELKELVKMANTKRKANIIKYALLRIYDNKVAVHLLSEGRDKKGIKKSKIKINELNVNNNTTGNNVQINTNVTIAEIRHELDELEALNWVIEKGEGDRLKNKDGESK